MASHENQEGGLDYGSGRYELIGRAGRDDHSLYAGEWLEVRNGTWWIVIQVLTDEWGRWYFQGEDGARMLVQVGMRARLVGSCQTRP